MSRPGLWPGGALLAAGIVMLAVPIHMQMTGLVLILLGAALALYTLRADRAGRRGKTALQILAVLACAGVIGLTAAMSLITSAGKTDWSQAETADYAVVLGASVREDGKASRIMRQRLSAAQEFMERNPDAMVILSGGQGGVEPMSEAQCMYETLVEQGADETRLLLEQESETTRENLQNSMKIIASRGGTDRPVAVITSEFHLRRAMYIGSTLGLETCPVAARTDQWFFRVNYTLREVFAFVKAVFQRGVD